MSSDFVSFQGLRDGEAIALFSPAIAQISEKEYLTQLRTADLQLASLQLAVYAIAGIMLAQGELA